MAGVVFEVVAGSDFCPGKYQIVISAVIDKSRYEPAEGVKINIAQLAFDFREHTDGAGTVAAVPDRNDGVSPQIYSGIKFVVWGGHGYLSYVRAIQYE